jgi:predicted nucleic acid-binding protein
VIVVDPTILTAFWLPGDCTEMAEAVKLRDGAWAAPILWRAEFRAVLAGYLRQGLLTEAQAVAAYQNAQRDLTEKEFTVPAEQILKLVLASECTAFECEYLALALDLEVPLVTRNEKLSSAFPKVALSLTDFAKKKT